MRSQESELKRHQVIYDLYQPLLANSCNCNNSVGPDTSLLTPPLAGSSNLNFPPKQRTGWKFNTESLKSNHLKSKTVPTQNDDLLLKGSEDLATLPSGLESKSKLCLDRRFVLEICGSGFQFRFESLEKVVDGKFGIAGVFEWVHKRQRNNEWNQEWQREHTARAQPLMWNQSGRGFRLAVASHVRLRRCWTLTGADWWGPSLYSLMMVPQHPVPRGGKHFFFFLRSMKSMSLAVA